MIKLKIRVKEIIGHCPVYKTGDNFSIENGYKICSKIPICMHSLGSIMPYYIPLSRGITPQELGLSNPIAQKNTIPKAYLQCLDPCKYTNGGTVIFEISRIETKNNLINI